ncbi:transposase [Candidatus Protofrankia californiensis]|uniref:transposase n=1 Tax=Candidatus Protofrankia californiensis TaxID=1839754 RepID=UPI003D340CEB
MNRRNGCRAREGTPGRERSSWRFRSRVRALLLCSEWLTRPRRAEQALIPVVATSCLLGVPMRRVDRLVEQLGVSGISKSQVSALTKHRDTQVETFRSRPLDGAP